MDIKTATEYFHFGIIRSVKLLRAPMTPDLWMICLDGKMGSLNLETALNAIKYYSSLDTAIRDIERITGGPVVSLNVVS